MVLLVMLLVCASICRFLYASFAYNAFPILPFNVRPSQISGKNNICYTMEGIFDFYEYSEECGRIQQCIEKSQELDTLCIFSVLQYAWKKDSLLMEVSLKDGSNRWLLATPTSSDGYKCKLVEVGIPINERMAGYCNIKLENNALQIFLKRIDIRVALVLCYTLCILYGILVISLIIMEIGCLSFVIKYYNYIKNDTPGIQIKKIYVYTPMIPVIVWILLRVLTYMTIY